MTDSTRHSTGNPALDEALGGGLLPGRLTVVVGSTGIGKTQLGIQYARAGSEQEGRSGVVFDMTARGDSQSHLEYARRMFGWELATASAEKNPELLGFFETRRSFGDYLHVFEHKGRRVTRTDLEFEEWHAWQGELNARLAAAIAFLYGNFIGGVRRVVVDGIEPSDKPGESIQFHLFEYLYHQVLRKEPQWVARDLFRQHYRELAEAAAQREYPIDQVSCLLLATAHEALLDELIARPLDQGDALSNANTLIYMGKVRQGDRMGRALYISKHRGSACDERIIPYRITDRGIELES